MCSKHFRKNQYLNYNAKKPKLVHDAVPFIPDHLSKRTSTIAGLDTVSQAHQISSFPEWIGPEDKPIPSTVIEQIPSSQEEDDDDEESDVSIEVCAKEIEVDEEIQVVLEEQSLTPETTYSSLMMENFQMKEEKQQLASQLKKVRQRLALMEGHVHRLSRLAGESDCVCSLCTDFSMT